MKKLNKKGFTIVELVIVIAVIGILSAVLIPTFSNLTEKANESAALQEATNKYKEWLVDHAEYGILPDGAIFALEENGYVFEVVEGVIEISDVTYANFVAGQTAAEGSTPLYKPFVCGIQNCTDEYCSKLYVPYNYNPAA